VRRHNHSSATRPPLGVNATDLCRSVCPHKKYRFQWAPTLGGECYKVREILASLEGVEFQWAPTLGGECYNRFSLYDAAAHSCCFNGHPPLGVNATQPFGLRTFHQSMCFSGHPPLGVNATGQQPACFTRRSRSFQSAPTLEGECYSRAHFASRERRRPGFNGHPPLGVNATKSLSVSH